MFCWIESHLDVRIGSGKLFYGFEYFKPQCVHFGSLARNTQQQKLNWSWTSSARIVWFCFWNKLFWLNYMLPLNITWETVWLILVIFGNRKRLDPLETYIPAVILTEVQIKELGNGILCCLKVSHMSWLILPSQMKILSMFCLYTEVIYCYCS